MPGIVEEIASWGLAPTGSFSSPFSASDASVSRLEWLFDMVEGSI